MNSLITFLLFVGEIFAIYFFAHIVLNMSFTLMRRLSIPDTYIIWLISFLYLPGTIIHEISHYFFALLLAMNPEEVSILPHIEKNHIRLGHVIYRKHPSDIIRPIIVGIAPFFGAIGLLWVIQSFHLFPSQVWWQTIIFGYLILAITANMFSSKQDLIDLGYIIPLFLIVGVIIYIFGIQINVQILLDVISKLELFFKTLQLPLLFSIIVNGILIIFIRITLSLL
jgi:hypothetical protein